MVSIAPVPRGLVTGNKIRVWPASQHQGVEMGKMKFCTSIELHKVHELNERNLCHALDIKLVRFSTKAVPSHPAYSPLWDSPSLLLVIAA
jgi:hypothetical protein